MPFKDIEKRREKIRRWRAANPGYQARYYQQNKEKLDESAKRSRAKHPDRARAREKVSYRVNRVGKWPKASFFKCSDCGVVQAQHYHHEDYSLWWSVEPLCHKCHGLRHCN